MLPKKSFDESKKNIWLKQGNIQSTEQKCFSLNGILILKHLNDFVDKQFFLDNET